MAPRGMAKNWMAPVALYQAPMRVVLPAWAS